MSVYTFIFQPPTSLNLPFAYNITWSLIEWIVPKAKKPFSQLRLVFLSSSHRCVPLNCQYNICWIHNRKLPTERNTKRRAVICHVMLGCSVEKLVIMRLVGHWLVLFQILRHASSALSAINISRAFSFAHSVIYIKVFSLGHARRGLMKLGKSLRRLIITIIYNVKT